MNLEDKTERVKAYNAACDLLATWDDLHEADQVYEFIRDLMKHVETLEAKVDTLRIVSGASI